MPNLGYKPTPLVNTALKGTLDACSPESCRISCRRAIGSSPALAPLLAESVMGPHVSSLSCPTSLPVSRHKARGLSPGSCSSEIAVTQAHSP